MTSSQELLLRGSIDIFPEVSDLLELTEKPLRIKLGIDPTSPDIHLGHSILFRKLRAFQDAGHTAVLIIGDFTAQIGDPTGKNITRVQLTAEQVKANAKTYLTQLGQNSSSSTSLLDFDTPGRLEIHYNSEWLEKLSLTQMVKLMSISTVGQMLAKDDFANRHSNGNPIALHEFLYPLLQGYDSLMVNADVELGGTDQKFNVAMGRDVQRHFGQTPQFGLLMPILPGLDGVQKMSKSLGNTVNLTEDALSMYSKLEKVPDTVVNEYLTLLTNIDLATLPESLRERQKVMALAITTSHHGEDEAKSAQLNSLNLVSSVEEDISTIYLDEMDFPIEAHSLLTSFGICSSTQNAFRQILAGGVRMNDEQITNPHRQFMNYDELREGILQLGKNKVRLY